MEVLSPLETVCLHVKGRINKFTVSDRFMNNSPPLPSKEKSTFKYILLNVCCYPPIFTLKIPFDHECFLAKKETQTC